MISKTAPPPPTKFRSLGTKLGVGMTTVVALACALVFVQVTSRERHSAVAAKLQAAAMVAELFAASVAAPLDFGDADALDNELKHLSTNRDVTYAVVWATGREKPVDSRGLLPEGPPLVPSPGARNQRITADGVEVERPVLAKNGTRLGSVVLRLSLAQENADYDANRFRIFWLCVALAISTLASLLGMLRRWIISGLDALGAAVRKVQRGEPGALVTVRANDEIGQLGYAFNAMQGAIFDREQRLAAAHDRLRELFDHMRQAIVVFDRTGEVSGEWSREATAIFGDPAGRPVKALIYPDVTPWDVQACAFGDWIASAFDVPPDAWSEWAALAPQEATVREGKPDERVLELEFLPIVQDDQIVRIMLLATDATETRHLQRAGKVLAGELAAVRRRVAGGGQVFVTFLEGARRRGARCKQILLEAGGSRRLGEKGIEEIFRNLHTIKGEALAFDLTELAAQLGRLEGQLDEAKASAAVVAVTRAGEAEPEPSSTSPMGDLLAIGLDAIVESIAQSERRFVEASPLGRGALDQTTVSRADVSRLCELTGASGGEIARIAARLASRPFGELVASLGEKVPAWAEGEGKEARFEVEGREVLVPPALARILGGVVTHLVRNAIAHGIELPEARLLAGKERVGIIAIACTDGPAGPLVELTDDGGGLSEDAVRASAIELGLGAGSRMSLTDLVFSPGLSTASSVSAIAGRGVGLSAVREELREVGYEITPHSESGKGTRFMVRPSMRDSERGTAREQRMHE